MFAGWMCIASRYFATVLRATWMPCCARMSEMRWSESGFLPSSAATSCLMSARIAVEEHESHRVGAVAGRDQATELAQRLDVLGPLVERERLVGRPGHEGWVDPFSCSCR